MSDWKRGDIVLADLGYVAKTRPALVVSTPKAASQRSMTVIAPITTDARGGECEVPFPKPPWLSHQSVVNLIGVLGVDDAKILRRLGPFPGNMAEIDKGLRRMLAV